MPSSNCLVLMKIRFSSFYWFISRLVFLSIAKIYGITDYAVRCLSTNCTLLQHVNMHGCWRVTDGAVQ